MNIRTLCLGILQFQDATGYEINKLVTDGRFRHFIEASYGSIYPALTRMMAEGLVTCREEQQEGKPARKVYSIAPAGRAQLIEALQQDPHPDRFKSEFLFLGLFADFVPRAHMRRAIERQKADVRDLIAEMRRNHERCQHAGSRFALGCGIAANEAKLHYIEAHEHLLLGEPETATTAPDIEDATG
jgi:DNA-binding PadR family transcriptional regulator